MPPPLSIKVNITLYGCIIVPIKINNILPNYYQYVPYITPLISIYHLIPIDYVMITHLHILLLLPYISINSIYQLTVINPFTTNLYKQEELVIVGIGGGSLNIGRIWWWVLISNTFLT